MAPTPSEPSTRTPLALLLIVLLAVLGLHGYSVIRPELVQDDFQILARGTTWERTRASIWEPQNEHAMPLGRLLTFAMMRVGGRATVLPWTAALVGPLALLVALPLVYRFVGRECGHPWYGLIAAALFGVSSVYQQAVYWFAASFSLLALDTLLLALLAVQRWKESGHGLWLDLAAFWCFLAPAWFASGILAGPLCCLYLLWPQRAGSAVPDQSRGPLALWSLVPLLGTLLFLAVSLPRTAEHILHLEHYGEKNAFEAFDLRTGIVNTNRSIVDNLLLGFVGVSTVEVPKWVSPIVLGCMAGVLGWWWRLATQPRLILLGLGLILSAYLLVYSARAMIRYDGLMTQPSWSRYHLLPQLGLALIVAGGLPGHISREFAPIQFNRLTRRQVRVVTLLVIVLFVVNLPRALLSVPVPFPGLERWASGEAAVGLRNRREEYERQRDVLRQIAEQDDRCRALRISADQARNVLPAREMPGRADAKWNGLELLRGSDDPLPRSLDEVRRLLEE